MGGRGGEEEEGSERNDEHTEGDHMIGHLTHALLSWNIW